MQGKLTLEPIQREHHMGRVYPGTVYHFLKTPHMVFMVDHTHPSFTNHLKTGHPYMRFISPRAGESINMDARRMGRLVLRLEDRTCFLDFERAYQKTKVHEIFLQTPNIMVSSQKRLANSRKISIFQNEQGQKICGIISLHDLISG
jgi:hypothetical protein